MPASSDRCTCGATRAVHDDAGCLSSSCGCTMFTPRPIAFDPEVTTLRDLRDRLGGTFTNAAGVTFTATASTLEEWEDELQRATERNTEMPAETPRRPDNRYVIYDQCLDRYDDSTWCNAAGNHTGAHRHYLRRGEYTRQWPALTPAAVPARPDNRYVIHNRCLDQQPGNTGVCTAERNHTGEHRAYRARGEYSAAWPGGETPAAVTNAYEPDHPMRCLIRSPAGSYYCYARRGHAGDHIGYGHSGARPMSPAGQWSQPPPLEGDPHRQCGAVGDANGGQRWRCRATRGHDGSHVGYLSDGRYEPDGVWGNQPGNAYEPDHPMRCLTRGDARRYTSMSGSYECFARRGHTGDHIGYHSAGNYDSAARWPQAPPPARGTSGAAVWLNRAGLRRTQGPYVTTAGQYVLCGDALCQPCSRYRGRSGMYRVASYDVHPRTEPAYEPAVIRPRKTPGPNLPERLLELLACSGSLTSGQAVKATGDKFSECTLRRLVTRGVATVDTTVYPHVYSYVAPAADPGYVLKLPKGQRRVPKPVS